MGDLKLMFIDFWLVNHYYLNNVFVFIINIFQNEFFNGFNLILTKLIYFFPKNLVLVFSIKFLLCISFLVLIRGGTPRYRYDYLTKLGWLKFLTLIILIFALSLLFFFIF